MQTAQIAIFVLLLGAILVRRLVFGFAVVPLLQRHAIEVPAPYYPWRMNAALRDYRRLCSEQRRPLRWWKLLAVLDAVGLAATAGLILTLVL